MQKIYFEKLVDLDHQLIELSSISVDESINYKIEDTGMRAQGRIDITGEYLKTASKERFNEHLEIDILAPFEKVMDQHDFNIKVEDFDYKIQSGDLLVTIQAIVYGVEASEDRFYNELSLREEDELDQELIEEIKEVMTSQRPIIENIEPVHEKRVIEEKVEVEEVLEQKKDRSIDDLIEISDQNDLVPYFICVAMENDDYDTISSKYNVPSTLIREYNHNTLISKGTLIIVPYYEA